MVLRRVSGVQAGSEHNAGAGGADGGRTQGNRHDGIPGRHALCAGQSGDRGRSEPVSAAQRPERGVWGAHIRHVIESADGRRSTFGPHRSSAYVARQAVCALHLGQPERTDHKPRPDGHRSGVRRHLYRSPAKRRGDVDTHAIGEFYVCIVAELHPHDAALSDAGPHGSFNRIRRRIVRSVRRSRRIGDRIAGQSLHGAAEFRVDAREAFVQVRR